MRSLTWTAAGLLTLQCMHGGATARAAQPAAPPSSADVAIPAAQLMQPEELAQVLGASGGERPLIFQVGPRVFYAEAHVPGSEYIGATAQEPGIQALRERVKNLPHDRFIVVYCGCCPWIKCPNVKPAYRELTALGFDRVKVMYIADNFGKDWVSKGYPVEKGR
jgi:thiosulfate/3-mercaptopyruvate sulfurtransferase